MDTTLTIHTSDRSCLLVQTTMIHVLIHLRELYGMLSTVVSSDLPFTGPTQKSCTDHACLHT